MDQETATPLETDSAEEILAKLDEEEATETPSEGEKTETPDGEVEAQAETPEAEETQEEPRYTVKVDGVEHEVTLDELTKGYSRTQDYTRKTEEVARHRREVETEKAAIQAERQHALAVLNQAVEYAQTLDPVLAEAQKTDWAQLAREDPSAYVARKAEVDARQQHLGQLLQQRNALIEQYQQTFLQDQQQKLAERLPEWRTPEGKKKIAGDVSSVLKDYGYSDEEIQGIADHRLFVAAADLAKYKRAEKAKQTMSGKKVAPVTKVQKPTAGHEKPDVSQRATALKKRALQSGRDDDTVAAALAILGD